jgi:hypothetical protein
MTSMYLVHGPDRPTGERSQPRRGWLFARAFLPLLVGVVALAAVGEAQAQTRVCRQLEAQLASLGSGDGGGSRQSRRYEAAIERQRDQIAIARDQAREAQCGFAIIGRNTAYCANVNATIGRMQRNLAQLERERGGVGAGGGSRRDRSRILAAMERNGCIENEGPVVARRPSDLLRSIMREEPEIRETRAERRDRQRREAREARLREREIARLEAERASEDDRDTFAGSSAPRRIVVPHDVPQLRASVETFRTMCVRTCDGYFFPMSPSSTVRDFQRDQANCETSCPGTEMQVFYGPEGSDDPAAMMSTAGMGSYGEMPTAFLHQKAGVPRPVGCGCNATKDFEVIAGSPAQPQQHAAVSLQPVPDAIVDDGGPTLTLPDHPLPQPRPDRVAALPADAGPVTDEPSTTQPPAAQMPEPAGTPPVGTARVDPAAGETPAATKPSGSIMEIPPPAEPAATPPVAPAAASPATEHGAAEERPIDEAERKVRVVGPVFLPDPEGAIDLQAPGRTPAQ